jgi:hypothetical protein
MFSFGKLQLKQTTKGNFDELETNLQVGIGPTIKVGHVVQSLDDYIESWRKELWDHAFFKEFNKTNDIHKGQKWKKQIESIQVLKQVMF